MPIYQRPTDNIGVTKTFSGTITDGSSAVEGSVVALKRKGGDIVAFADTDASGNYSFDIDADGDFQIVYSLSKDPQTFTISDEIEAAKPYSAYGNDFRGDPAQVPLAVIDFPQTHGSPASFYEGTPTVSIVDDVAGGIGSGAEVSVTMAEVGDPYGSYSSRVIHNELFGGIGKPLRQYTLSKLGKNYYNPVMRISGTVIHQYNGSLEQLAQAGITTGFTHNSSTYYKVENTYDLNCSKRQLTVVGVSGVEQIWGTDHSTWGQYDGTPNDYRFGRCTASFPGEQDKSNFDTTAVDNSVFLNGITNTAIMKGHGQQFYYTLIYGPGGTPQNFTQPGLSWAASQGLITQQELDIIKGYIGTHFYVADLLTGVGINPIAQELKNYSNIGNFMYQMTQAIETTVDNAGNGNVQWTATHPDAISNNSFVGYLQYYSLTFKDLMVNIGNEYRSFNRQKKGVDIPTSSYSSVIYPILKKAGVSTIATTDGSTTRNWSLTSSNISYQ